MTSDQGRKNVEEIFRAMETPEKWKEFKRAKNKIFTGKIDTERAGAFSYYLTNHFIDVCNDKTIAGRFLNWEIRSADYKVDVARDIVNLFIKKIKDDILNGRVTMYTNSGEVFTTKNELIDKDYRQSTVDAMREINVTKDTNQNGFMTTSNIGDVSINTNCVFYNMKSATLFLMDLRHELTHVIDVIAPNISPLDPEIRIMALRYYDSDNADLYSNNPLELSANTHRKEYRVRIQQMLNTQEQMFTGRAPNQDVR